MRKILLFLCLLYASGWAQEEITQVSSWSDPFGNQASFWKLIVRGKTYLALKVKSPEKPGEAHVVLDKNLLDQFEQKVMELKSTPNSLRSDGLRVLWTQDVGDSKLRTLLGRWQGIKVKLVQVEENKNGKFEHQITVDGNFGDFARALKKARAVW